jgi:hypothetical protein
MEPPLLRFVSTLGINFIKIGPLVDYYGERLPAIIKTTDLLDGVFKKNQAIWNLLTNRGYFGQGWPQEVSQPIRKAISPSGASHSKSFSSPVKE